MSPFVAQVDTSPQIISFSSLIAVELLSDLEGAFQGKIDAAYFDTSKYLLDVLNRDYLLLEHLQAMRRYLLLGQGDFIRHLMDLLKLVEHPYRVFCFNDTIR